MTVQSSGQPLEQPSDAKNPPSERSHFAAGAEAALRRAARRARETAARFGRGVLVMKDGRIVEEWLDGTVREYSPDAEPPRAEPPETEPPSAPLAEEE